MNNFKVSGKIKRFPGKYGWYYVELNEGLSKDLRPLLASLWPALLKAEFRIDKTIWQSSIMPINYGPLFIALPAKIRKAEGLDVGNKVIIYFVLKV
ncbi:MAG TPA: DUF1905 domain-containing protein [Acinetobacter johnsonii]|jgi:hypothetical protein|nr:DUF1905 domain-containing protein [Acinetobacter johnsonii]